MNKRGKLIYAFVDAANLFYGGEKSLHWKIDYKKLLDYLKEKLSVSKVFYYAGVDVDQYKPDDGKKINLDDLVKYYEEVLKDKDKTEDERFLLEIHYKRAVFYRDLDKFGYSLRIKPTKVFTSSEGTITTKANCDVDLTFDMMRYMSQYSEAVVLTGDGDFAPVLEYLKKKKKKISILARSERTAWEVRELAGDDFIDFKSLRKEIEADKKATPVKGGLSTKKEAVEKKVERPVRRRMQKKKIPTFRKGF